MKTFPNMKNVLWFGFSILVFAIAFYSWSTTWDHTRESVRKTIVVNKLPGYDVHKHRVSDKFYLILKEASTGKVFDLDVVPALYSEAYPGQVLFFKVSDEDIKHSHEIMGRSNLSQIVMLISGISALIAYAYPFKPDLSEF